MSKNFKFFSLVLSIFFCLSAIAFGQERTGRIEGTIKDPNQAVVPNATVAVAGASFNKTVQTDGGGFYRVLDVPPGEYVVTVTAANFNAPPQNDVTVTLGQATVVDFGLQIGGTGTNVVTVTAGDEIGIDATASKIQTNLTAKNLELLPKGTNFTSALKAAPAVRPEVTGGGFQIDGASGSENTFVLDGQEVTNFRTGALNQQNNVPFQLVQEIQIKSNGFEAEFGGATGGVINVVSKRGGNKFFGEAGLQFETSKLFAINRPILNASTTNLSYIRPTKDTFDNVYPSLVLGGPIVKNRLTFFASYLPQLLPLKRSYTFANGQVASFKSDVRNDYDFVRLDGEVNSKLRVNATYLYNPTRQLGIIPTFNQLSTGGATAADFNTADLRNQGGRIPATNVNVEGFYNPTQSISIDVRFGRSYLNEKISNYGVPNTVNYTCSTGGEATGGQPPLPGVNCNTNFNLLNASNFFTDKDISIRRTFDALGTFYLNNFGGRHSFKGGYQYNGLSNDVNEGYVTTGIIDFAFRGTTADRNGVTRGYQTAADPNSLGVGSLTLFGTSGKAKSKNEGLFIQDSWQPFKQLTLNLGVRIERENVPSFRAGAPGIEFKFKDKIAPRLGVAYDVLGNGKLKAFASYGQFYDRFKYELPRGSFGGDIFYVYDFVITNPDIFSYQRNALISNNINFTDFRVPSNDPSDNRVDPNLKAFRQTEFTVGTEYEFGKNFIFGARYTRKKVDRAIEDIGYHNLNDDEEYYIGNPGFGVCAQPACGKYSVNIPGGKAAKAKRQYDALELRVEKRLANDFFVNASYTYSRLFGNYSGLASSDEAQRGAGVGRNSPNVNRNFDLPFIGFTADGKPDDGRLPTDRPHAFKVAAGYQFKWFGSKSNLTDLNIFQVVQSGTPVTTRTRIAFVSGQIVNGRGDLGRTKRFAQTDFSVSHTYHFGREDRLGVAFDVNILNLLNSATELSRRETNTRVNIPPAYFGCPTTAPNDTPLRCIDRGFFNGQVTAAKIVSFAAASPSNRDVRYNQAQLFQDPRSVRFGFRFLF